VVTFQTDVTNKVQVVVFCVVTLSVHGVVSSISAKTLNLTSKFYLMHLLFIVIWIDYYLQCTTVYQINTVSLHASIL
jgi:hypothetical protein